MSLSDYHKELTRRVVTQASDGAGGYTESTTDSKFLGYIAPMTDKEVVINKQKGSQCIAKCFTGIRLNRTDRVIDHNGSFTPAGTEFEVEELYQFFHNFYGLKSYR